MKLKEVACGDAPMVNAPAEASQDKLWESFWEHPIIATNKIQRLVSGLTNLQAKAQPMISNRSSLKEAFLSYGFPTCPPHV